MARFELDDGRLRKFWEVALDGEVLTFRYGDLGEAGRTRSKRHRSERHAKASYDEAVRAMLSQGYRRIVNVPERTPCSAAPAWPRLEEDPDDPVALAVHADWLQSRGDVRGEVLALELAGMPEQAVALREAHRAELYGPIDAFPGQVAVTWSHGYVRTARFEPSDHRGVDPAGAAAAVLASESLRLVREVDLQVAAAAQVVTACHLPALRRLFVHTGIVGGDWQPSEPLDLDRLAERMPRLRTLKVRGVSDLVGCEAIARLEHLDLRFAPGWAERIIACAASLRSLAIHGVDANSVEALAGSGVLGGLDSLTLTPSWNAVPRLLPALGRGRCARRLVLSGLDLDRVHVQMLCALEGLEELVLDGAVTPAAERALLDSRLRVIGDLRLRPEEEDDDDEPERPTDLEVQRFEYSTAGTRRYFWEIGRDGAVHHVRYGAIGSRGRWIWRRFPSEDISEEIFERRIEEKLREGYRATPMRVVYDARAGASEGSTVGAPARVLDSSTGG
ncbi:MAG: WGR domain-containing protein [Alphaproteobacteria bacterium]|nr:WGR domain-containing protein [Alphaproteobacteria bacterium]